MDQALYCSTLAANVKVFDDDKITSRPQVINPLVHSNTSDMHQLRYSSTFTGEESFLNDHKIQGQKILPGVAYFEMARVVVQQALPSENSNFQLHLKKLSWVRPFAFEQGKAIHMTVYSEQTPENEVCFEAYSEIEESEEQVHFEATVVMGSQIKPVIQDLKQLKELMQGGELDPERLYDTFAEMGLNFGEMHKGITSITIG